jgi:hypothetical protein
MWFVENTSQKQVVAYCCDVPSGVDIPVPDGICDLQFFDEQK